MLNESLADITLFHFLSLKFSDVRYIGTWKGYVLGYIFVAGKGVNFSAARQFWVPTPYEWFNSVGGIKHVANKPKE